MRKLYSLVLLATALLIGTNAWANGVIEIVRGGVVQGTTYNYLREAFEAAKDGDILQLTDNISESPSEAAWFGESTSGTLENYESTDRAITIDLKGHTYTFSGNPRGSSDFVCIAFTRGKITVKSTGGKGEIKSTGSAVDVFRVYGTYLKIDAKEDTPFTYLVVEENVKITSEKQNAITVEVPQSGQKDCWKRETYPLDYSCHFSPISQHGVSNGVRLDIKGELTGKKYGLKPSGNIRIGREFYEKDEVNGGYKLWDEGKVFKSGVYAYVFTMVYDEKNATTHECYKPGTTRTNQVNYVNVNKPEKPEGATGGWAYSYVNTYEDGGGYEWGYNDSVYSPYIHIHPSARLVANNPGSGKAAGYYAAGYARTLLEGYCEGSTGVYVKAGDVEINNATITSNWASDYQTAQPGTPGAAIDAGGSAIVIDSNEGWTGSISVEIGGDTKVSTEHGYAIDERITNNDGTHVDYLTITGGTFQGGEIGKTGDVPIYGSVYISQPTLDANSSETEITTINVLGANITSTNNKIGDGENQTTLADFLSGQGNNTHITYVEVPDPNNPSVTKTTMVISEGAAPDPGNKVSNQATDASVKWQGPDFVTDEITASINEDHLLRLTELQINDTITAAEDEASEDPAIVSGQPRTQTLYIRNGATLEVKRVILGPAARIIVEAGGKLIVNGTQGISAPVVDNIELRSTADEQAYFLFNPAVSSNKNPNASVVVSTVCRQTGYSPWTYVYQRIASPLKDTLTAAPANDFGTDMTKLYTADATNVAFENYLYHWDMAQEKWVVGPWNQMAPFTGYQLANNSQAGGVKYTFSGKLVGNQDGNYRFAGEGFDFFGNSYTAPIYIENIFAHFNNAGVQASVWVYDYVAGNYITITPLDFEDNGYPTWLHGNNLPLKEIAPFAGFILKLDDATNGNVAKLNYAAAIWGNPDVNPTAAAPARHSQETADRVTLRVDAANGNADMIKLVQSDRFSEAFDNGADASKYISENGINLYAVTNDGELARVATNDLENTVLAFRAGNATEYTISVPAQSGETFMLRDMVTNQTMLMEAGSTYAFNQDAYSTNDARFEIISAAKMPTAIDNTEVKANVKGIYTITGQYVGENFEILPAGVYVVNGVKIVK